MIPLRWKIPLTFARLLPGKSETPSPVRFVILAKQRSGSTWLGDLLHSHPRVVTFAELFHSDLYGQSDLGGETNIQSWNSFAARHEDQLGSTSQRTKLYFRYLDDVVFAARPETDAIGVKLMYNQAVSAFGILAYLVRRNVRIVHLIRRNYLDGILSQEALLHGQVSLAGAGSEVKTHRFELEAHSLPGRLRARRSEIEAARSFYSGLGVPYHEVGYEELVDKPERADDVLGFLSVDAVSGCLTSGLVKLHPSDQSQRITNFAEITETLRGTEFEDNLRGV